MRTFFRRLGVAMLLLLVGCSPSTNSGSAVTAAPTSTTEASTPEQLTTTSVGQYRQLACPDYSRAASSGRVSAPQLTELSGLATSRRKSDVLWTHNDSGDTGRIFAISQSGTLLSTVELSDVLAFDFEDIASAAVDGQDRLYVADIGDNLKLRGSVQIYSFEEPTIDSNKAGQATAVTPSRLSVRYRKPGTTSEFTRVDAESFIVDRQGNGYIVEKRINSKTAWVFRIAAGDMNTTDAIAEPMVEITTNRTGKGAGATGADLSKDGTILVIKNYNDTFLWSFIGNSVSAALITAPTAPCRVQAGRGEAVAISATGDLTTVEEGSDMPLLFSRKS